MAEADTRPGWLEERICLSLKVKPTLFKKLLESEGTNRPLLEFLNNNDAGHVFFVEGPKELQCFDTPPAKVNKKAVYFVKLRHAALTNDNMDAEIVSGELVLGALSHMYRTCQEVSAVAHVARRPICRASPRRPWPPSPTRAAAAQRGRRRHAQLAAPPPPPPPPSPPPPSLSCLVSCAGLSAAAVQRRQPGGLARGHLARGGRLVPQAGGRRVRDHRPDAGQDAAAAPRRPALLRRSHLQGQGAPPPQLARAALQPPTCPQPHPTPVSSRRGETPDAAPPPPPPPVVPPPTSSTPTDS